MEQLITKDTFEPYKDNTTEWDEAKKEEKTFSLFPLMFLLRSYLKVLWSAVYY